MTLTYLINNYNNNNNVTGIIWTREEGSPNPMKTMKKKIKIISKDSDIDSDDSDTDWFRLTDWINRIMR